MLKFHLHGCLIMDGKTKDYIAVRSGDPDKQSLFQYLSVSTVERDILKTSKLN